jgi:hypothetical protein
MVTGSNLAEAFKPEWFAVGITVAGFIFYAGGFYLQSRHTRRQVNGVGRRLSKVTLYLQETADGENRRRLTDVLKD